MRNNKIIWVIGAIIVSLLSSNALGALCNIDADCDNYQICSLGNCLNLQECLESYDCNMIDGNCKIVDIAPSVCNGQLVNVTVEGIMPIDWGDSWNFLGYAITIPSPWMSECFLTYNSQLNPGYNWNIVNSGRVVSLDIGLFDNDAIGYDQINQIVRTTATTFVSIHDSINKGQCLSVPFKYTFKNVDLSKYKDGSDDVELYAVCAAGANEHLALPETIDEFDGTVLDGEKGFYSHTNTILVKSGQCGSGACCDLNTCNYKTSTNICNPKESTKYTCYWGTSAGNDVGVRYENRFCSGTSSSCNGNLKWGEVQVYEDCNANNACKTGYSSCQPIRCSSSSDCGTDGYSGNKYCSANDVYQYYKKWRCYNAGRSDSFCSPSITSNLIQTCSNGCSNGACLSCNSHASYQCADNNDVYWYDSCGNKQEMKEDCSIGCLNNACVLNIACSSSSDCGTDGWVGTNTCSNGDIWNNYKIWDCVNPGTAFAACVQNTNYQMRTDCADGFANGVCNFIFCDDPEDCGTNSWIGTDYCNQGDVWNTYKTWNCHNPGTVNAYCSSAEPASKKTDCADGCLNGACLSCNSHANYKCAENDGDIYWYNSCNVKEEMKEDCGESGYIGDVYCSSGNVYKTHVTKTCAGDSCISLTDARLQETCKNGCSNGVCLNCNSHASYRCADNNDVYWYDSCNVKEEIKQDCSIGCLNNACVLGAACSANSDCGTNGWVGTNTCSNGDIWNTYRTWSCTNPGTSTAACVKTDTNQMKTDCINGCFENSCIIDSPEGYLWTVNYNKDKINKLTTNGTIVKSFNSPGSYPMEMEWDGKYLWHIDWGNYKIYKLTVDGNIIKSFNSPGDYSWGLAWDGEYLWSSNPSNNRIYKLTTDGIVVNSLNNPVISASGLTWDGEYLWSNDRTNNKVYKLTTDGIVVSSFNGPEQSPIGLTWDGKYLWSSNYITNSIYKLTTAGVIVDRFSSEIPVGLAWQSADEISCNSDSECGADEWIGTDNCSNNDVWNKHRKYICINDGITDSYCTINDSDKLKEDCAVGCLNGACVLSVACSANSDCGTDGWVGTDMCVNGDVYNDYKTWTCNNPGTVSSKCTSTNINKQKQDCQFGCSNRACITIACSANSDCGTNSWIGTDSCSNGDVWNTQRTWTCTNPGTSTAACVKNENLTIKTDCVNGCTNGACTVCNSHAGYKCNDNDVYYYNSCNAIEDKKQECGESGYVGENYCSNGNVYKDYVAKACAGNSCTSKTEARLQEACKNGCSNRACITIACSANSDCGEDMWLGTNTCSEYGDVFDTFRRWNCANPGTVNSACVKTETNQMRTDCIIGCLNGACLLKAVCNSNLDCGTDEWIGTDTCSADGEYVWNTKKTWRCLNPGTGTAVCKRTDWEMIKNYCTNGCYNGACVVCSSNSDCGTDSWVGTDTCTNNDVWNTYRNWSCVNPGTVNSACVQNDANTMKNDCVNGCINGTCIACNNNADCGEDGWVGSEYQICKEENIWGMYQTHICVYPGSINAECDHNEEDKKLKECEYGCNEERNECNYPGKADFAWFIPANNEWRRYALNPITEAYEEMMPRLKFGSPNDIPVPADYDKDFITEIAVYRKSDGKIVWADESGKITVSSAGNTKWKPAVADYDGDGKADYAWFDTSALVWKIYESSKNYAEKKPNIKFGSATDIPVPADFNGDKKSEIAMFSSSDGKIRWINPATNKITTINAGNAKWKPAVADYDGDGKADYAWYDPAALKFKIYKSSNNNALKEVKFGDAKSIPVPADYDGDRYIDIAVFRGDGKIAVYLSAAKQIVSQDGNSLWKPAVGDYDGE